MQNYVVGFLHDEHDVVLIKKNRPDWQRGLLNGIGGHIEETDFWPVHAMTREFEEETGVHIHELDWDHFLTLEGPEATIYVYAYADQNGLMKTVDTKTDEEVDIYDMTYLDDWDTMTVPNLRWIIPLMMQRANYLPVKVKFYGDS
jgi:8-oxo-dGTP diphosphatase